MNFKNMAIIKKYLISFLVFIGCFFLSLVIASSIFAYTNLNDRFLNIATYIIVIIPSFVSSFLLAKLTKNKGMIHGIILNIICMNLLFIIFSLLNKNIEFTNSYYIYLGISVLCGILGGVLGVNL